mgnify:CR=1 FL=1
MMSLIVYISISVILAIIIQFISFLFLSNFQDSEKLSTYECGFEPYEDSRNQVHIHFYIIAVLFLIFDLEIILLFPFVYMPFDIMSYSFKFFLFFDFILELVIGYIYVWRYNLLDLT